MSDKPKCTAHDWDRVKYTGLSQVFGARGLDSTAWKNPSVQSFAFVVESCGNCVGHRGTPVFQVPKFEKAAAGPASDIVSLKENVLEQVVEMQNALEEVVKGREVIKRLMVVDMNMVCMSYEEDGDPWMSVFSHIGLAIFCEPGEGA